ncbi:MAG: aspartate dehydrogenase [Pseudomonadota bacterium]
MHLAFIGFGAIAAAVLDVLPTSALSRLTVLVRPSAEQRTEERLAELGVRAAGIVARPDALVASRPDLAVECAGHAAVEGVVVETLRAGIDTVVASVGALADPALQTRLEAAAATGEARLILPPGAIGGLDVLGALALGGDVRVRYRGTKPPTAWVGTPAEEACDLSAISEPKVVFEGSAREAALAFPKNANVVAALALAGPGFDGVDVTLIADPGAVANRHAFEIWGPTCNARIEIEGNALAGNARSSGTTALSLARTILDAKACG